MIKAALKIQSDQAFLRSQGLWEKRATGARWARRAGAPQGCIIARLIENIFDFGCEKFLNCGPAPKLYGKSKTSSRPAQRTACAVDGQDGRIGLHPLRLRG